MYMLEGEATPVPDLHDQINELEGEIERLAEAADRCERMMLASKLSVVGGGTLLMVLMNGVLPANPPAFLMSVAAVLGGTALFGSTKTTHDRTRAALKVGEAEMSRLIGMLDLRVPTDGDDRASSVAPAEGR
jgi:hypothetical protein